MMISCNSYLKKSNYNVYNDSQPLDDIKKKKISLSICKNCGFLFQNPKPTKKFLKKYYSKNINASGNVFFSKDQLKKTKYYQRFKFLDTSIELKNIKEVLEIGSSEKNTKIKELK